MTGTGAVATAINGNKWRHRMKTSALGEKGGDASLSSIFFYDFLQLYKIKKWKRKRIRWEGNFKMTFYSYIK
jgi:hypothetical protein